jgi:hypothetical protein
MRQTNDEIRQSLGERLCWEVVRRNDARVARSLSRKPLVAGVYRPDEGALLDDCFPLPGPGGSPGIAVRGPRHGHPTREGPLRTVRPALWAKTLFGIESMNALPGLLFIDAVLRQLVGLCPVGPRRGVPGRPQDILAKYGLISHV